LIAEAQGDSNGRWTYRYGIRLSGYKESLMSYGEAMAGQPEVQPYFHRSLEGLFGAFFRFGYILDGLEEPTFTPTSDSSDANRPTWRNMNGIPPVLVARMRVPATS
jgi:hypothetical protein